MLEPKCSWRAALYVTLIPQQTDVHRLQGWCTVLHRPLQNHRQARNLPELGETTQGKNNTCCSFALHFVHFNTTARTVGESILCWHTAREQLLRLFCSPGSSPCSPRSPCKPILSRCRLTWIIGLTPLSLASHQLTTLSPLVLHPEPLPHPSSFSIRDVVFVVPRVLRCLGYANVGRIGFALTS